MCVFAPRALRFGGAALLLAILPATTFAQGTSTQFATIGDWWLFEGTQPNGKRMCEAMLFTGSEQGVRFGFNENFSFIGFSGLASAVTEGDMSVAVWFDGDKAAAQTLPLSQRRDLTGFPWRSYRSPNTEPDGMIDLFQNKSSIHFGYDIPGEGWHEESFPLTNSSAVLQRIVSCVYDPASTTAAPAATAATADGTIMGSCKLVVDGVTYIDKPQDCAITMEEGGIFWINTDRDTYLGDYFATLEPQGDGTGWAHWNGEPGATHAQALLGEDLVMGQNGCWSNARATICAAR